jgi:hypothetical protein
VSDITTDVLLLVKLKSSLPKFYGRHHDLANRYGMYVSQLTTDMFLLVKFESFTVAIITWLTSVTNDNGYFLPVMTYNPVCNKSNTTGDICGAGIIYPSRAPELTPDFIGVHVTRCLIFCVVLCRKNLKIPNGQSESVYRRMAKRTSTKGQTTINKTYI